MTITVRLRHAPDWATGMFIFKAEVCTAKEILLEWNEENPTKSLDFTATASQYGIV